MELPNRLRLPCGNYAEREGKTAQYRCTSCMYIVGSTEEPADCRVKREDAEIIKNDYWMDIDNEKT